MRWGAAWLVGIATLCAAAPADAQLPQARITSGPPAETTATDATFTFEASGFAPLTAFECALDGAPFAACRSPHTVTGLLGGPHGFSVRLTGGLSDPKPAVHRWTVLAQSQVLPPPPDPPAPGPPALPRASKRRDAGGCAYGGNRPGEAGPGRLARATVCLINGRRSDHGLRRVRVVSTLGAGAVRHARDMVRRRYFEHVSPGGSYPADRLRRSGYIRNRRAWTVGEVLAWGTGRLSTPHSTVQAWMRSPGHRRVLLYPAFRDVGVGVVRGVPLRGRPDGGTYAGEFGRR
jgi:uncharacterized protein YkwD